jgi:hypothetical protein
MMHSSSVEKAFRSFLIKVVFPEPLPPVMPMIKFMWSLVET